VQISASFVVKAGIMLVSDPVASNSIANSSTDEVIPAGAVIVHKIISIGIDAEVIIFPPKAKTSK